MKTHNLKLRMDFCDDVLRGKKTFEIRYNDRGYQVGDLIKFRAVDNKGNYVPCMIEIVFIKLHISSAVGD